jgi:hypothetical protein
LQEKPHTESVHVAVPWSGIGQAMPQSPQCVGEAVVSIQAPSQLLLCVGQVSEQLPSEQTLPMGHLFSHDPQRFGSLEVSTHVPQLVSGPAQTTPQTPSLQLGVPPDSGHFMPQPPQLSGSAFRSTHALPQGVKPSSQPKLQRLAAQPGWACVGAVQVALQPPQLFGSVERSTQLSPQAVSSLRQDSARCTHKRVLASQT